MIADNLPPLANYGSAIMGTAMARRADPGATYVPYHDTNLNMFTMHTDHDLSTVGAVDSTTMRFTWHRAL